jgi:hypothetical protein
MIPGEYTVILLRSTSYTIRAEKVLHGTGIQSRTIPVPRHLSSDCGVCLRIAQCDRKAAEHALQQAGVEVESVHDIWREQRRP